LVPRGGGVYWSPWNMVNKSGGGGGGWFRGPSVREVLQVYIITGRKLSCRNVLFAPMGRSLTNVPVGLLQVGLVCRRCWSIGPQVGVYWLQGMEV